MVINEELSDYILVKQREITKLANINLKKENTKFNHRKEYYRIQNHVDLFLEGDYYNRFIVMPGLRGVGKTTILFQIYEYLIKEKNIDNSEILYLDLNELTNFFNINLFESIECFLYTIHETTMVDLDKKIFILIDESQYDKKWALTGKLIFDKSPNIFMIFTGSKALDLEINVDAVRRIKKEPIFPCNFSEYLLLKHNVSVPNDIDENIKNLILKGDSDSFNNLLNQEKELKNSLSSLNNDPHIEFRKFLFYYGFPFALNITKEEIHKKTIDIINRIIERDIPSIKSFNTATNNVISRIIIYLGMQKPGGTSNNKIAQSIGISPKLVNDILSVLEKTQLIFSIKPYGTGTKVVKKPWEYFFLSPSIKSSINYELGRYDIRSNKCLATLAETLVISSIFKLNESSTKHLGLFYDSNKGGVDFLIKDIDKIIPIEVGIGKKTKSQLIKAINKYDSEYGVLISNRTSKIKYENNIVYIPLMTFGFL